MAAGTGPRGPVVLDIEGTTSPAAYVFATMYPYAAQRFGAWLAGHPEDETMVREEANGRPALDALLEWSRQDLKVTALKSIQGKIWAEGFAAGDLVAPFFPDVIPALRAWHAAGRRLFIYSSGSAAAQRAWFGHTPEGDLGPLIDGYFDTQNAGPKREPGSYEAIAAVTGHGTFLSDVTAELDAARAAGWHTIGVRRPGEPHYPTGVGNHPEVSAFTDVTWTQVP